MKVFSNTAITLDGKISNRRFEHVPIASPMDRKYMSVLRARADAVLVGGRTFRNFPYPLVPDQKAISALKAANFFDVDAPAIESRPVWNVVVNRSFDIPNSEKFFRDPRIRPLILSSTHGAAPAPVESVDEVTIPWILRTLAAKGINNLLVEAGGDLLFQFFAANAIDEIYVTLSPVILGGYGSPTMADGIGFSPGDERRFSLAHAHPVGDEVFCKYVRRCPES